MNNSNKIFKQLTPFSSMKPEKKIKKEIISVAKQQPELFYPVSSLESLGFKRYQCSKCEVFFWSSTPKQCCGEPECIGGYSFIKNSPAKHSLSFQEVYKKFSSMMKEKGYTPIPTFPCVARWRDDLDFTIASIVGFQPYVVKGEVEPVANPLTIPQYCLRFGDIDNVGYTGRHHTSFTMIGQHAFLPEKDFNQEKFFTDWIEWYIQGVGIPKEELTIHEDAWAGGGNCGASLEVFAGGLELGNQVYMSYDMTSATSFEELKPLSLKVLDMGMGQERFAWYSQGARNSYEASMPKVCTYLFEKTKLQPNWKLYEQFLPISGSLNIDEVDNIEEAWKNVAKQLGCSVEELKSQIDPLAHLYAIADHTRTLLYAIADGALPSNVKGGYNLRILLRRCLEFIEEHQWDLDLYEIMKVHAEELIEQYPHLLQALESSGSFDSSTPTIKQLLDLEKTKFYNHKEKISSTISQLLKKNKELSEKEFISLYVSKGISPFEIQKEFEKEGKTLSVPSNFYSLVSEFFEEQQSKDSPKHELLELVKSYPKTELLYYQEQDKYEGECTILDEITFKDKQYIILDKTLFYPLGGGASSDIGKIGDKEIVSVIKVGDVVLHQVK
jgi:alanyl-tRNA synthetase